MSPKNDRPDAPTNGSDPGRVLVTGASGLIGSALAPYLTAAGYEVLRLKRTHVRQSAGVSASSPVEKPATGPDRGRRTADLVWDAAAGLLDAGALEGIRAVVHLAGENLARGRWSPQVKERILRSRVAGTRLIAERLAALSDKPELLLCASAVGFYGHRGEEPVDEASGPGDGFLASVVRAWEQAAAPAVAAGIRVVHLRMGAVLSTRGGALARMLPLFRAGLGARFGSGRQQFSWIALDDLLAVFAWTITDRSLRGPVNATAPGQATSAEFTRVLARVAGRPAILAIPAWTLRLALGEMAKETLLAGSRVLPARLLASGFAFTYPDLEPALHHLLRRGRG